MKWFRKKTKQQPVFPKPVQLDTGDLDKMHKMPFGQSGTIHLGAHEFEFHHARCFYDTYKEVFKERMYEFKSTDSEPYIIDCGANMGLSVLYFAQTYPGAQIVAFEPEPPIYELLLRNIQRYELKNITVFKKALWNERTTLEFFTDTGMGGSVENKFSGQVPVKVETELLSSFITKPVDFLKIDIEGAELTVLKECSSKLHLVRRIFVEYHSYVNKPQQLPELLQLLTDAGFRYHIKESFVHERPFIDTLLACENMDMAITIFAYRNEQQ
jgi:FkbM family methyltransferase